MDRQFFTVDDMSGEEEALAATLFEANRQAAQAKAGLAKAISERMGLTSGTLKVYAKWGRISAEIVEPPKAKASGKKISLADYLAQNASAGR